MATVKAKHVDIALEDAITNAKRAAATCVDIKDTTEVPEAFKIVARRLPFVSEILRTIKTKFSEFPDAYSDIKQMADDSRSLSRRLDELFETVEPDDGKPFIERYRQAVGKGEKLEGVMKELLSRISDVAKLPFALVSSDELAQLEDALKEVKNAPPSLDEDRPGYNFNNWSSGIMPVHLGKGHVNIHSGNGVQFNGNPSGGEFYFGTSKT